MSALVSTLFDAAHSQGLSQKQWAERLGMPPETLSRLKRKKSVQSDVLERLARSVGLALTLTPAPKTQPFREKYKNLVWSNPNASPEVFLRQALLRPEFTVLLDAALEFGLPALLEQWRVLQAETTPEALRAAPTTSRMLRNLQDGQRQAAA
ncbi:MAG: hypothetical protein RL758_1147 [Pseudomonadota bacterium]|jgi:transcriptional regulator with XRE-family HTH domain